jgi:3-oxoacyl-[acyl-carrier protein] reductase
MTNGTLRGQVALVTGSSRRTGRAIALEIARAGAAVVVHYRSNQAAANEVVAQIAAAGGRAEALAADLTRQEQVESLISAIESRHERLDLLVNNVGSFLVKDIADVTPQEWRSTIETTVTTTFVVCRTVLPLMQRRGYGRVVNFADSGADLLQSAPNLTPYMVGKTGVLLLTKSLAERYAGDGITINAISPGVIDNSVTKPPGGVAAIPMQRFASDADITNAVMFLLQPQSGYITGANLKVGGGWHA